MFNLQRYYSGPHVQAAIASRKRELQCEQQELEAVLAAGTAANLHPLDQPDIQPAIKVCRSTNARQLH
jgi:hypothetical protein